MRSRLFLLPLVGVAACHGAGTVRASRMPEAASPCVQASTSSACIHAIRKAADARDAATTGQLLTLAAAWLPEGQRLATARAGAWLAPRAWAPDSVLSLLDENPAPDQPLTHSPGKALLLRGAPPGPSHASSIDLEVPAGKGLLAGRDFAVIVAAAAGATSVAWGTANETNVASVSPLLDRIAALPPVFDSASWKSAELAGTADANLRLGHRTSAYQGIGTAIDALPRDAAACRTRGVLRYLQWTLAGPAYAGTGGDHYTALGEECTSAEVPESEKATQDYLKEISLLQIHRGTEGFALPREWIAPDARKEYVARTDAMIAEYGDARGRLLSAIRAEMLARTQQPEGPCDTGFTERWKRDTERARNGLAAVGRHDMAMPRIQTKMGDGGIMVHDVGEVMAWVDAPEHKWMRLPALTGALAWAEIASPSPENAKRLEPVCAAAQEAVEADIKADRADGYEGRNVLRLLALFRGAAVCGAPERFDNITELVLESAAKGPDGKLGVARTLGLASLSIAEAALHERIFQALLTGKSLQGAMQRMRTKLGTSDEDIVLDATFGIVLAIVDRYTSERGDITRVLDGVIRRLEPIVQRASRTDAAELVRYAPVVHLVAHVLLVAYETGAENPDRTKVALARLDAVLERDVTLQLAALGEQRHADAVTALMRSMAASAKALRDPPKAGSVMALATAANRAGREERGWWSIGLNVARVAALDLAAYATWKHDPRSSLTEVMNTTDEALVRLADGAVRDFPQRGRGLQSLHLLPAVHRAVIAGMATDEEGSARAAVALDAASEASAKAFARMTVDDAAVEEAGMLAVLMDALRLAASVGGPRKVVADERARLAWSEALASRAERYPAELSLVAQIAAGVAAHDASPEKARERFEAAAALADKANPRNVPYLPMLVEAAVRHHGGDTAGALTAVDRVIEHGKEARSCNAPHEVDALLPYRAWALESLGRHGEADETLATFLERTKSFSGRGKLECRLASYRPTFVFTANVSQQLDRIFFRGEFSEGSLQSGAGFSDPRNEDRLVCYASPDLGVRSNVRMQAYLTRAVYAFRAGDRRAASSALVEAVSIARRLRFSDDVTVGLGERVMAELDKKESQLSIVAWASAIARARGHMAAADELDQFIRTASAKERDRTLASVLSEDEQPPSAMEKLGFEALGPWVKKAWGVEGETPLITTSGALEPWQVVLVAAHVDTGPKSLGRARLRTLRPNKVLEGVIVERARARLARVDGKPARAATLVDVKVLANEHMPMEAVAAALEAVEAEMAKGNEAEARDVVTAGMLATASAPLARADLLLGLRSRWPDQAATVSWAEALAGVHGVLEGRVSAPEEVAALHAAATLLCRARRFGLARPMLGRIAVLMGRALGEEHANAITFAALGLAARAAEGQSVSAEARPWVERAKKVSVPPAVFALLKKWAAGEIAAEESGRLLESIPPL